MLLAAQFSPPHCLANMFKEVLVNTVQCWLMRVLVMFGFTPLSPPNQAPHQAALLPAPGQCPPKRCKTPICDPNPTPGWRAMIVRWLSVLPVPRYAPVHSLPAPTRRYPARARVPPVRFCSCQSLDRTTCTCDLTIDEVQ